MAAKDRPKRTAVVFPPAPPGRPTRLTKEQRAQRDAKPPRATADGLLLQAALAQADQAATTRYGIRRLALLHYITDPDLTVEELNKKPPFNTIPLSTFVKWAGADEWLLLRQQTFDVVRNRIVEHVAKRQVEAYLKALHQTSALKERVWLRLKDETFSDASAEKLISGYCKLIESELKLLGTVETLVPPPRHRGLQQPQTVEETPLQTQPLSVEEAREAALAVMRVRRREIERQDAVEQPQEVEIAAPAPAGGTPGDPPRKT